MTVEKYEFEDEEMRQLFVTSSEANLSVIENLILRAEELGCLGDEEMRRMMRSIHALKGDCRMVGVTAMENLAHTMEDVFINLREKEGQFLREFVEVLLQCTDAMKTMVGEISRHEESKSGFSVLEMSVALYNAIGKSPDFGGDVAPKRVDELPADESGLLKLLEEIGDKDGKQALSLAAIGVESPVLSEAKSSSEVVEGVAADYIRVSASRLEILGRYATEMVLAQQQLKRRVSAIDAFKRICERSHLNKEGMELLNFIQRNLDTDLNRLNQIADDLSNQVQQLQIVSVDTLFNFFPRSVRDISKGQGKEVILNLEGGNLSVDRQILENLKTPLTQIIRNAIDHGIEKPDERERIGKPRKATIGIKAFARSGYIEITVNDDGRGLDIERIREIAISRNIVTTSELERLTFSEVQNLIFRPGFSTKHSVTDISGRGMGLDIVKDMVDRLQGRVEVDSTAGMGTNFKITVPVRQNISSILLTSIGGQHYGFPVENYETAVLLNVSLLKTNRIESGQNTKTIVVNEKTLDLIPLNNLNNKENVSGLKNYYPCLIYKFYSRDYGFIVDDLINYQDVQIRSGGKLTGDIGYLIGTTILDNGEICYCLNVEEFINCRENGVGVKSRTAMAKRAIFKILLVEDSIPIRTQLYRILIANGYDVTTAEDGLDGYDKLRSGEYDCILSDVEMPRQNGLDMIRLIRQNGNNIPIILLTTLNKEGDKTEGIKAGANAYLTKGDFDQDLMLKTIREVLS